MTGRRMLAFALVWAWGLPAAADASPVDAQVQAARELFQDAVKDEDGGNWSEALSKLQRVSEVRLTAGVRYHVALCEEHLGQIATAFADYGAAENQARAEGAQDVLRLVGKQISALGPRVPRLTVHFVPDVPEAELRLDGVTVAHALVGVPMPVDPGVHHIEAVAPDRPVTNATVTLRERDSAVLDVNLASPVAPPPAAPTLGSSPTADLGGAAKASPGGSRSRVTAIVSTGVAAALAAGGAGAFVVAGNAHASGQRQCADLVSTDAGACDTERTAVRSWDFTAAGLWLGAAAVGVVSVLSWSSHDKTQSSTLLVGPGTVALRGVF
jgi:hypothetical protein